MDNDEIQSTRKIKLNQGPTITAQHSQFLSYFQKVKSVDEVGKGYHKMKIRYGDVTHIAVAFWLSHTRGPYSQEGSDNGELGAGRFILKVLKQKNVEGVCVYIVHYHRFENGWQMF